MKIKKKNSKNGMWKPVALDEGFINKGVENLIAIEELTDYTIINKVNIVVTVNSEVKIFINYYKYK